jgi:hypothetical protein
MAFERIWHKSYAPGVPPAIEPERITISEILRRTTARFPERTAFYFLGRKERHPGPDSRGGSHTPAGRREPGTVPC